VITIPQREPSEAVAGDTWHWQRSFADYPPSTGWSVKYLFSGPGSLEVAADPVADQSGYDVTVDADDTARIKAGVYEWAAIATHTTDGRKTVARGITVVTPDFEQLAEGDLVTHEEKMVTILRSVLEGRAEDDVQFQIIGGRQIQMIPIKELQQMYEYYGEKVRKRRAGGRTPSFLVTFR